MCKEGKYDPRWMWGCGAIMVVFTIVLSVVINYSVGLSNQVQIDGDGDSSSVKASTGIHPLRSMNLAEVASVQIGHGCK